MRWIRLFGIGFAYFFRRNLWNFLVMLAILGIAALGVWQSAVDNLREGAQWSSGLWLNFATEMLGAVLTFALFEVLINANNRQEGLLRQMMSRDNATALNAVNELRALGYLFDGTLEGKKFIGANLANADLSGADMRRVDLRDANLEGAILENVAFDHSTILPDASRWSANSDLHQFTHPSAPTPAPKPKSHPKRVWQAKRKILL